ncbi:MAG TPA: hypothetical protein VFP10_13560 [Candidatus Eisenbacteria bacterium]|nr:hypothetical protein [Candidatus Eisenbacteria bacterium]
MFRVFLRMTLLVMFMGVPTLCLAGVVEHLCSEGPETASCSHEEGCDEDPCSDVALRPELNPREWTLLASLDFSALEQSPHLDIPGTMAVSLLPQGPMSSRSSFSARRPLRI